MIALLGILLASALAVDPKDIKYVHVINSCHLDLGFAGSAQGIVNEYFTSHFPRALSVAEQLKEAVPGWNFMFQSWVVYLYLHCPPGWGFRCPSAAEKAKFEQGIRDGIITWHAFPYNAELETMGDRLIAEGVGLTHRLDAEFGLPPKRTLSQRDVPGTTRSVIPTLLDSGVQCIAVGVNGGSSAPEVPRVFRWLDENSGRDMTSMWHPHGYGGWDVEDSVMVEGWDHALMPLWKGDNKGPGDNASYVTSYKHVQSAFPNAQVFPSTYDNFTSLLETVKDKLPKVTSEIGDTWIYGIGSDPVKTAKNRIFNRIWDSYQGDRNDSDYLNATFWILKNGEHTWGRDVKSNLKDNTNWTNVDFEAAKAAGVNGYNTLEQSWFEEREWGLDRPMDILHEANHPLASALDDEFSSLDVTDPSVNFDRTVTSPLDPMKFGDWAIQLSATGSLISVKRDGKDWVENEFAQLRYKTYNQTDFVNYIQQYAYSIPAPSWFYHDLGKPGLPKYDSRTYNATLSKAWATDSSLLVLLEFPAELTSGYGGAQKTYVQYDFGAQDSFNITFSFLNKTSTRLPESMHLQFHPNPGASYSLDKLGEWIDPLDVVTKGSKRLHAVQSGFVCKLPEKQKQTIQVNMIDSGLLGVGEVGGFPVPLNVTPAVDKHGVNAILWNNLWGTNYIMWYPFGDISPHLKYRFRVTMS